MTAQRGIWHPIVDGAAAVELRGVIDQIAAALRPQIDEPSLADGAAGRALFFGYLAEAFPDGGWGELAGQHLERSIDLLAERALPESLYGGFTGVAWVAEHLQAHLLGPDDDDPNAAIDDALGDYLARGPWRGDYDLIVGLTGIGVYALERLPRPSGRACLERVLARLSEIAVELPDGLCWLSRPELMLEQTRSAHPEGYYNLGVAHGVPATIAMLSATCRAGVGDARTRQLLDGAVAWMLAQRRQGAESQLAYWVDPRPGQAWVPARAAWCYGDPGAALSLLAAARAVAEPAWESAALAMARQAAARPVEHCAIADAGLCHGAIGLAHLFNRAYQASGDETFAGAARDWLGRGLAMRKEGAGVAGFQSLLPGATWGALEWGDDHSFLTGVGGVGLALLAMIAPVEPLWDRVLASAVPPHWAR